MSGCVMYMISMKEEKKEKDNKRNGIAKEKEKLTTKKLRGR